MLFTPISSPVPESLDSSETTSFRPARFGIIFLARAVGLVLVLAGYWAPWVAHASAGLAIAEIDFNEFPKFMPQVRSGELEVWREAFYLTLLGPAVGLTVWASGRRVGGPNEPRQRRPWSNLRSVVGRSVRGISAGRWMIRLIALGLLLTPSVFNVFEGGEFQTQVRLVAVLSGLIVLSPLLRRFPARGLALMLAAWFVFCAVVPAREFMLLLPALEAIYRRSVTIGWGFWSALAGFAVLVVAEVSEAFGLAKFNSHTR